MIINRMFLEKTYIIYIHFFGNRKLLLNNGEADKSLASPPRGDSRIPVTNLVTKKACKGEILTIRLV